MLAKYSFINVRVINAIQAYIRPLSYTLPSPLWRSFYVHPNRSIVVVLPVPRIKNQVKNHVKTKQGYGAAKNQETHFQEGKG